MLIIEQDPHGRILDVHGGANICYSRHWRLCHGRRVLLACVGLSDFLLNSVRRRYVGGRLRRKAIKSTYSFFRCGSAVKEPDVMLQQALKLSICPSFHSFEDDISVSHFYFAFASTDINKDVFDRPCSRFSCRPSGHEPDPSLLGLETTTATANVRYGT